MTDEKQVLKALKGCMEATEAAEEVLRVRKEANEARPSSLSLEKLAFYLVCCLSRQQRSWCRSCYSSHGGHSRSCSAKLSPRYSLGCVVCSAV